MPSYAVQDLQGFQSFLIMDADSVRSRPRNLRGDDVVVLYARYLVEHGGTVDSVAARLRTPSNRLVELA